MSQVKHESNEWVQVQSHVISRQVASHQNNDSNLAFCAALWLTTAVMSLRLQCVLLETCSSHNNNNSKFDFKWCSHLFINAGARLEHTWFVALGQFGIQLGSFTNTDTWLRHLPRVSSPPRPSLPPQWAVFLCCLAVSDGTSSRRLRAARGVYLWPAGFGPAVWAAKTVPFNIVLSSSMLRWHTHTHGRTHGGNAYTQMHTAKNDRDEI